MDYESIKNLKAEEFKRLTGVKKSTFQEMVKIVTDYVKTHKKVGRKNKLTIENQILLTLDYFREYRTYFHLGKEVGLSESNVCRTIQKIEKILVESKSLALPGKKVLKSADFFEEAEITVVIDVTETEIERPQRKQKKNYSGKKKKHTKKTQIVAEQNTSLIICTAYGEGSEHDFTLFKKSKLVIAEKILVCADKGYQGIHVFHENSQIPHKKKKDQSLTIQQKKENKELAKKRIMIEHINRKLKVFRILSSRYRNRKHNFGMRFNLIAGIYNYEVKHREQLRENL